VELAVAHPVRRRTAHHVARLDEALGQPGGGHEELEDRTRRIHALGDPVLDGMARVVAQFLPLVGGHAEDEEVVVVARLADHGQDLARHGLHDHDGAGLAVEQFDALALELEVDGKHHVAAGRGRFHDDFVVLAAEGVHFHLLAALAAPQRILQGIFQALLAHGIAQGQLGVLLQLLLVGLGHVPQHVGHERAGGIVALLADDDLQARIEHGIGLDAGQGLVGEIGDEDQGLEGFDPFLAALVGLGQDRPVHAGPFGHLGQGGGNVLAVLAHEPQGEGRFGHRKRRPVLVHDAAPGRIDEHLAQLVVPGHLGEPGALVDLEKPQTQGEQAKKSQDQDLQENEAGSGRMLLRGFAFKPHRYFPASADGSDK